MTNVEDILQVYSEELSIRQSILTDLTVDNTDIQTVYLSVWLHQSILSDNVWNMLECLLIDCAHKCIV